jgi:hypothetical protein
MPNARMCDDAIWRFTMLVADSAAAIRVTAALRRAGLNASNHYWSVAHLLQGRTDLPNADLASPRLLNLWVDAATPIEEVDRAVEVIWAQLAEPKKTSGKRPVQSSIPAA